MIVSKSEPYYSHPVPAIGMTLEFFEEHAAIAREKGLTHWATTTDKSDVPWVVSLVFYEADYELKEV